MVAQDGPNFYYRYNILLIIGAVDGSNPQWTGGYF